MWPMAGVEITNFFNMSFGKVSKKSTCPKNYMSDNNFTCPGQADSL